MAACTTCRIPSAVLALGGGDEELPDAVAVQGILGHHLVPLVGGEHLAHGVVGVRLRRDAGQHRLTHEDIKSEP